MAGLNQPSNAPAKNGLPPQELLDDLCSRFVLNVPREDLQSFERILFLVEYAHWFYEDNSVENNPSLKSFNLKEFTSLCIGRHRRNGDTTSVYKLMSHMRRGAHLQSPSLQPLRHSWNDPSILFNHCDVLKPYVPHIDDIFKDFTSYKLRVPVTGAIILDETFERCLLVKGWKGSSWSFPRGKKSKDEEDHACAIREVLEETGFDVTAYLIKEDYIEVMFGLQRVRLYIIAGVKNDAAFAPLTKKEISEIAWHRLDDLLPASDDVISHGITGLKLYMVAPFLASLRTWILTHQPPVAPNFDLPMKGVTMWNAKNSSISSSSMIFDSQPFKFDSDPGKSLRNFKFDTASILQAMESAFAA